MGIVGLSLSLVIAAFFGRSLATFITEAPLTESLRDSACGTIRERPGGIGRVFDEEKQESTICYALNCAFCMSGWGSLFGLILISLAYQSWIPLLFWPAAWGLATILPERVV